MSFSKNKLCSFLKNYKPANPLKVVTLPAKIGHTHWIRAMIVKSADSIFTCGNDGTIREWDITRDSCKKIFHLSTEQESDYTHFITSICLLPDNKIAVGSADTNIYTLDLGTGEILQIIKGHTLGVTCLTTLLEGNFASGSSDQTIQIIDSKTGEILHRIKGHDSYIGSLCTLPNGDIISGSNDQTIKLWGRDSFEKKKRFTGHSSTVSTLAIVNENTFISGSADKTLRLWNISSGECLQQFEGHTSNVTSVAVLTDGRIISASRDETIKLWDGQTGACLRTFSGSETWITAVVTLPNNQIVSGGKDQTIRIWSPELEKYTKVLPAGQSFITELSFLKDGWILSKNKKEEENIWNPKNGLYAHKRTENAASKRQFEDNKTNRRTIGNSLISLTACSEFIVASIHPDSLRELVSTIDKKELSNSFLPIIQNYAMWFCNTLEPYINPTKRPIFLPIAYQNSISLAEALISTEQKNPLKLLPKEALTSFLKWTELFQRIFKGFEQKGQLVETLEEIRLQLTNELD